MSVFPGTYLRKDGRRQRRGKHCRRQEPDIRLPEKLKRKEGLRTGKAEGEEDARELDAEEARQTDNGRNKEENKPYLEERQPFDSR
ncbi:hypothetical protein NDU88_011776 [Pleurodeles waltl]|uniref:Uncharacterized protein n=1 Tax=Pleurodeles waltl TaxID=8319 RepID=A0AAV7Q496_PLEWA|nr:hypothetical protein NDU88_011776 [Pleurodeles waltl]